MKLLLVFVSALVLVALGDVTPSEEEESVYEIKPEVVVGYDVIAGQEAYILPPHMEPQVAKEAPGVLDFFAEDEPNRLYVAQEPAAQGVSAAPESGVYIPSVARVCGNAWCYNACRQLGFRYGVCISLNTCYCYN